jgi:hypothetical protein
MPAPTTCRLGPDNLAQYLYAAEFRHHHIHKNDFRTMPRSQGEAFSGSFAPKSSTPGRCNAVMTSSRPEASRILIVPKSNPYRAA